ncbi:MAG: Dabb family protein [Acidobacteriota bacterium]|nr:Dabb family protein [Acidobacteriota bacterium]
MILFRPKEDLPAADRAALVDAMRAAHRAIPQIRRFIAGSRLISGRAYDASARDFPYFAMLEFDSSADLAAYLAHPAHERLGRLFYQTSESAEAYDFESGDVPGALDALR